MIPVTWKEEADMEKRRFGRRRALLYQKRFNEMVFWPAILILSVVGGLLVWDPPEFEQYRAQLLVAFLGTGLILILTSLFRLRAYVRCLKHDLLIQLPFHRLVIPYREIERSRPSDLYRVFSPREQRGTQLRFLEPLLGKTVLVLELERLPASRRQLRVWMGKYMLLPDDEGLVIPVRDWIAFDRELEELKIRSLHPSLDEA
jgi:hypothetical protein